MADIDLILRELTEESKGAPLTNEEVDTNFINLRQGVYDEEAARIQAVSNLQTQTTALAGRATELESDVAQLEADRTLTNGRVGTLEINVSTLNSQRITLEDRVAELEGDLSNVSGDVQSISSDILQFVNVNGDEMTGDLSISSPANLTPSIKYKASGVDAAKSFYNKTASGVDSEGKSYGNYTTSILQENDGFKVTHSVGGVESDLLYANTNVFEYKDNKIWHQGNDGAGSGLDADTLDGIEANELYTKTEADSRFVNVTGDTITGKLSLSTGLANGLSFGEDDLVKLTVDETASGIKTKITLPSNTQDTFEFDVATNQSVLINQSPVLTQDNFNSLDVSNNQSLQDEISLSIPNGLVGQVPFISTENTRITEQDYTLKVGNFVESDIELDEAQSRLFNVQTMFNTWYKFSHNSTESQPANSTELNVWSYNSVNKTISSTSNSATYVGFVSTEKYEDYTHEVLLKSTNSDDDMIGVVIAWYVDPETNREHTLSALRTCGGIGVARWSIVYNYTRSDQHVLFSLDRSSLGTGAWSDFSDGTRVKIVRSGNNILCSTTNVNSSSYESDTNYTIDLTSDSRLAKFIGPSSVGYSVHSQPSSSFSVLEFSNPKDTIFDVRDGYSYTYKSSQWTQSTTETISSNMGIGRFLCDTTTEKVFYTNFDGVIRVKGSNPLDSLQSTNAKGLVYLDSSSKATTSSGLTVESNHIKVDSKYVHSTYQQDIQFVNQANVEAPFYNVRSVASSAGNATKYNAVAKTKIINPDGDEDVASFGVFQRSDGFADACIHLIRKNYYPNPGGTWWRFTNNGVITTTYDTDWTNLTLASNMQHGILPLRMRRAGNIIQVNGGILRTAANGGTPGWTTTLAYTGVLIGQPQVVSTLLYTGGGTGSTQWFAGSVTFETTGAITLGLPVINNGGEFGLIINHSFSLDYY